MNLRKYFWLLFVLLWAQVLLGGWVSSNYAAAACYDFPACQGQLWPPQDYASGFNIFQSVGPNYLGGQIDNPGKTAVHVFHRVWAVVLSIACVFVFVAWWRRFIFLRRYVALLSILLAFQVLLGVMNVLGGFPLWLGAAHNVMAALLILCFSNLGAWLCLKK